MRLKTHSVTAVVAQPAPAQAEGPVEIGYLSEDGAALRVPIEAAWLVPFETGRPVRRFASRKGQRHLGGLWWSATTGAHVGFESWLERDHIVALDFDRSVVGIVSQPFWLNWADAEGQRVSHAPDYFARRSDGSARRSPDPPPVFGTVGGRCALGLVWRPTK